MTRTRSPVWLAALVACCAGPGAGAEFYRWTDSDGAVRISNVAPPGVRADGSLRAGHHPYSLAAQHARLRARLEREAVTLPGPEDAGPRPEPAQP